MSIYLAIRVPAWKQGVLWFQPRQLDQGLQGVTGSPHDFELHWTLSLVLNDDSARCHLGAVAYILNLDGDKVASKPVEIVSQVLPLCPSSHPQLKDRSRSPMVASA